MAVNRKEAIASLLLRLRAMGLPHELMKAFEEIPRQNFAPAPLLDFSYGTSPLPIECGQSMSSADQIARVLQALDPQPGDRILEIGTGSGYQAAILGALGAEVITLERWRTLTSKARQRLESLGLSNVSAILADGSEGIPGKEFDGIVINCSYAESPSFLLDQLCEGGVAMAPLGPPDARQSFARIRRKADGLEEIRCFSTHMQPVAFGVSRAI